MKAWQLGYELDTLIEWTNKFEDYNKFCHSPFSRAKKNGMATSLSKGNLYEKDEMVYEMRTAKTTSKVQMFGAGLGMALGGWVGGVIFDLTGGYAIALWISVAASILGMFSIIILEPTGKLLIPDWELEKSTDTSS